MRHLFWVFALLTVCLHVSAQAEEVQYTLALIKPNAVDANQIGKITELFETNGLRVAALKMERLSPPQAEQFYAIHKQREFFKALTEFMSSGPVVALVLQGPNAVARTRELMGETDPLKARPGTIRALYGRNVTQNAIHGSDSVESAKKEIAFFFRPLEIQNRF